MLIGSLLSQRLDCKSGHVLAMPSANGMANNRFFWPSLRKDGCVSYAVTTTRPTQKHIIYDASVYHFIASVLRTQYRNRVATVFLDKSKTRNYQRCDSFLQQKAWKAANNLKKVNRRRWSGGQAKARHIFSNSNIIIETKNKNNQPV